MKKLRHTLIILLSLLLLVATIYLLIEAPFAHGDADTHTGTEWKFLESGAQLISSSVFHP